MKNISPNELEEAIEVVRERRAATKTAARNAFSQWFEGQEASTNDDETEE